MSEKIVLFRPNQELQADDLNNMQSWLQAGLDHVVLDAIESGKAYSGFVLTKAAATQINISTGRLYDGGAVFAREAVVTLDLYNDLPVATRRYFAIVAWGQTVTDDVQPRNYLIDANTGAAEPQSVGMESVRYANLNFVKGTESADPQRPSVDATTLLLGYVLCDAAGIISVSQATENQIDNLGAIATRTTILEGWRAILAGMVDTLRTDLANLARSLLNYTPLAEFQKLVNIVANHSSRLGSLEESVKLISGLFLFLGRDTFLTDALSNTATLDSVPYVASINEGLRFPGGTTGWTGELVLLNANEPLIQTANEVFIPKPSGSRVRYDCSFPAHEWIEHRILAYATYHPSFLCHHLRPSRWRHRCGPHFDVCPPAQVWWHEQQRDPAGHILSFVGETWENDWKQVQEHIDNDIHWPRYGSDRWKYFWRDWVHLPHWDKVFTDYTHSGNHLAHTFFNAQDGWLESITLFLMRPVGTGHAMNLVISGCDEQGSPDSTNHTLRRLVLNQAALQACVDTPIHAGDIYAEDVVIVASRWGEDTYRVIYREIPIYVYPIRLQFAPVFLRAGQHFAFHVDSSSDIYFAVSTRDECYQVHQGHMWHYNGSQMVFWSSGPRSLRFKLHFCTWGRWGGQTTVGGQLRYEIGLQPLLLAGGIGSVDVLAEAIVPEACGLSYEVQVGGVWKPFDADPNAPSFSGAPTQLPFRAVMTGTTDLMPGFSFDESQVTLTAAPADAFHHYSDELTCASTSCIKVVVHLLNFVEDHHNLDCAVHYGATHHAADTVADKTESDGTITRTFTHNVSGVTAFQVELHGASDHVGAEFIVTKAEWFAKAT